MTIFTYPSNTIGGGGGGGGTGKGLEVKDIQYSDFTAAPYSAYPINTSSNIITVTLPLSPEEGSRITFFDIIGGSTPTPTGFGKNKLIIQPSPPDKFIDVQDTFELNSDNESLSIIYKNNRWSLTGGLKAQPSLVYSNENFDFDYIDALVHNSLSQLL